MASTVLLVLEYACVLLREKMDMQQNCLTSSTIHCRCGDTKNVCSIGGLVDIGETPIAVGSRYYRHLINFVLKPYDYHCLFRALKGLKYLMLVRISFYIVVVKAECLTMLYF